MEGKKEKGEGQEKRDQLGFADRMVLVCRRKDGSVKWETDTAKEDKGHSMAKTGMAQVSGLILTDVGGTAFDFVGIGTSSTAESADHTDLQASVKRKAGTGTRVTVIFTNDTAQIVATFSSGDGLSGTQAIAEGGVFTAVSAGVMLFRKIFTAKTVNWDDGDTLEMTAQCRMVQGS